MEGKYTNIKERLLYYVKNQGIGIENFLESIDMTYGSFKGKAKKGSLNSDAIAKIYTIYQNLNIEWLLTGNGEMLKNEEKKNDPPPDSEKEDPYIIELQKKHIAMLEEEISRLKKQSAPTHSHPNPAKSEQ